MMKNTLKTLMLGLLLVSTAGSSAFASNCESYYETKAIKRGALNMAGWGVAGTALFFAGLTPVFLIGAPILMAPKAIINKGVAMNEFDVVNEAINSAIYKSFDNRSFKKIVKKINRKAKNKFGIEMDEATIAKLIHEADVSMNICPLIRTKKNGDEVRGAMPLRGFVNYIATVAGTGNTKVKIVNHIADTSEEE